MGWLPGTLWGAEEWHQHPARKSNKERREPTPEFPLTRRYFLAVGRWAPN